MALDRKSRRKIEKVDLVRALLSDLNLARRAGITSSTIEKEDQEQSELRSFFQAVHETGGRESPTLNWEQYIHCYATHRRIVDRKEEAMLSAYVERALDVHRTTKSSRIRFRRGSWRESRIQPEDESKWLKYEADKFDTSRERWGLAPTKGTNVALWLQEERARDFRDKKVVEKEKDTRLEAGILAGMVPKAEHEVGAMGFDRKTGGDPAVVAVAAAKDKQVPASARRKLFVDERNVERVRSRSPTVAPQLMTFCSDGAALS